MILRKTHLTFLSSAFLCFALIYLHIFLPKSFELPTLVYCPLQKTWVKENTPNTPKEFQSLDKICAGEKRKNTVSFAFSLNTFQPLDEKSFFDYLEKGNRLFTEQNRLPDLPNRKLANHLNTQSAVNNFNQNLENTSPAHFSFAQRQRPPSNSISVNFESQIVRTLEKISRNINPRSPPNFI